MMKSLIMTIRKKNLCPEIIYKKFTGLLPENPNAKTSHYFYCQLKKADRRTHLLVSVKIQKLQFLSFSM